MSHKMTNVYVDEAICTPIVDVIDPALCLLCAMYLAFGFVFTLFGYRTLKACFFLSGFTFMSVIMFIFLEKFFTMPSYGNICYRMIRACMFLSGFTFGSAIIYLICLQESLMPSYGNVCVAVIAGILFGLITMMIQYVGLFMTGFHTGVLLAIGGLAVYDQFLGYRPATYIICIISMLMMGILCAILNLYLRKAMSIVGTSVYGSALIAICLDYFVERFLMVIWMWQRAKLEPAVAPPCIATWIMLGVWPILLVIGLIVQSVLTASKIYHEQSLSAQKLNLQLRSYQRPITYEERDEMKQRKYRYLYQVRTAHGDVISQSYVQALQNKAQCGNWNGSGGGNATGGGECSTLQSDSTHLTILACDHHTHTDSDDDHNEIRTQR